jgi:hypothetical protein
MKLKFTTIILFCLLYISASAQQEFKIFTGNTAPGTNQVKWMSKAIQPDMQFDVYRKTDGGTWAKLNTAPIKAAAPLTFEQIKALGEKPDGKSNILLYTKAMNEMKAKPKEKDFMYAGLLLQALYNNELAELMGIYYNDKTAVAGTIYKYKVALAGGKDLAESSSIKTQPYIKAEAPAGFAVNAKDKAIEIKWKYDSNFPLYRIARTTKQGGAADTVLYAFPSVEEIQKATEGKYFFTDEDKALKNGTTYYYKISGLDVFGNETKISSEMTATPKDLTGPYSVTGLKAVLHNDKYALLTWYKSPSPDCKGYVIYRSEKENEGFVKINTNVLTRTDTSFIDMTSKEGVRYYYYLDAEDLNGNKTATPTVVFQVSDGTPPAVPSGLTAKADTGKIYLSWNANKEADLQGYFIFRALTSDETNFNLLNKAPLKATAFLDTLPKQAGNPFIYKICAVDNSYNRSETTPVISIKMPDVVPPSSPLLIKAEFKSPNTVLQWRAPIDEDLAGFNVYRHAKDTGDSYLPAVKVNATLIRFDQTTYTDKVTSAKTFDYYVVAVDSAGNNSEKSNTRAISVSGEVEVVKPQALKATYDEAKKAVQIKWQVADFMSYKIYRKTDEGNFLPISTIGNEDAFTDSKLEANTGYVYKVRAISPGGEFSDSDEVTVTTK